SGNASRTSGRAPHFFSHRAATKPSPPLPPLPQTTATRALRPALRSSSSVRISSAAPRPAFSISVAAGMPSSSIARRSSRRTSAAVKSGCTRATGRGERRGLDEEVGEDRRVRLPPLGARRARQLDVEPALGKPEDPVLLRSRGGVAERVGGLDEDLEPWRPAVRPEVRVADDLEERAQAEGLVAVHADGGDLDPARRVAVVVAVNLREE